MLWQLTKQFRISNFEFRIVPSINWFGAILTGLLLFAAFPPLDWPLLAWIALVPLLLAGASSAPRAAFRLGLLAGLVFWLLSIAWMTRVTWVGWFLLGLYCALFMAGFAMMAAWWIARKGFHPRFGNPLLLLSIPALWVGWEFLRATLFSGFPWNILGVSQYENQGLIQIAEVGGVHLVSYLVVMVNTALALAVIQFVRRQPGLRLGMRLELLMALAAVALAQTAGMILLRALPPPGDTLKVAAVQVNIPQLEKWSESWTAAINNRLRRTSLRAIANCNPDLIVWPETVVPDFVRASSESRAVVDAVVRQGVSVLMGSMDFDESGQSTRYFNSAFLFKPDGTPPQVYAKRRLVLFGEYIPLERHIPFLRVLTPVEESFTAGREAVVFRLGRRAFSVLICFEDTIAVLARDCVRAGARLLINQTNDAWFDPSWASRQHMAHCVFRCVENRVGAVRAANTGITCFIDRRGVVSGILPRAGRPSGADKTDITDPEYLAQTVALPPADMPLTFYTRHGDILAQGCAAFTLTLLAAMLFLRRNHSRLDM